jgi:SAM-dependent methyltransferase
MSADSYRSLAAYYDLIYAQVGPDDIGFYLNHAARQAGPVLELGCGTGRITLPLARAGHAVTALDLSPAMLDQLRRKVAQEPAEVQARVQLVQGDMADFAFPAPQGGGSSNSQFALVIAPFRAFQHLLSTEQQRNCLACIRRHLAPGGLYIHDQFEPNYRFVIENMQRGQTGRLDCTVELPGGGLLQRYVLLNYDLGRQRLEAQFRLEEYDGEGVLRQTSLERVAMRLTHRQELLYLLELSGFTVEMAFDGYAGKPLGSELASELVLLCRAV